VRAGTGGWVTPPPSYKGGYGYGYGYGDSDYYEPDPEDLEPYFEGATVTTLYAIDGSGHLVQLPGGSWGMVNGTTVTQADADRINELVDVAGVPLQGLTLVAVPKGEGEDAEMTMQVMGILPVTRVVLERILNAYRGDLEAALGLPDGVHIDEVELTNDGETIVIHLTNGETISVPYSWLNGGYQEPDYGYNDDYGYGYGYGYGGPPVDLGPNYQQIFGSLSWRAQIALSVFMMLGSADRPGASGDLEENTFLDLSGTLLIGASGVSGTFDIKYRDKATGRITKVGTMQIGILGKGLTYAATWYMGVDVVRRAIAKGDLKLPNVDPSVDPKDIPGYKPATTTGTTHRAPKYDREGNLIDPGEEGEDEEPVTTPEVIPPQPPLPTDNPPVNEGDEGWPAGGTHVQGTYTVGIMNGAKMQMAQWTIYDAQGRKLQEYTRGYQEGKGYSATDRIYTGWDPNTGRATSYNELGWSQGNGFYRETVTNITYDSQGRIFSYHSEKINNFDDPIITDRLETYYDQAGRVTRTEEVKSWGNNGDVPGMGSDYINGRNVHVTTTYRYNAAGQMVGMYAHASGGSVTVKTTDKNGKPNGQRYFYNPNVSYSQTNIRYDRYGRIVSYDESSSSNCQWDAQNQRFKSGGNSGHTVNYSFDQFGRVLSSRSDYRNSDGSRGYNISTNRVYNSLGQLLSEHSTYRSETRRTVTTGSKDTRYYYVNGRFDRTQDFNKHEKTKTKGFWGSIFGKIINMVINIVGSILMKTGVFSWLGAIILFVWNFFYTYMTTGSFKLALIAGVMAVISGLIGASGGMNLLQKVALNFVVGFLGTYLATGDWRAALGAGVGAAVGTALAGIMPAGTTTQVVMAAIVGGLVGFAVGYATARLFGADSRMALLAGIYAGVTAAGSVSKSSGVAGGAGDAAKDVAKDVAKEVAKEATKEVAKMTAKQFMQEFVKQFVSQLIGLVVSEVLPDDLKFMAGAITAAISAVVGKIIVANTSAGSSANNLGLALGGGQTWQQVLGGVAGQAARALAGYFIGGALGRDNEDSSKDYSYLTAALISLVDGLDILTKGGPNAFGNYVKFVMGGIIRSVKDYYMKLAKDVFPEIGLNAAVYDLLGTSLSSFDVLADKFQSSAVSKGLGNFIANTFGKLIVGLAMTIKAVFVEIRKAVPDGKGGFVKGDRIFWFVGQNVRIWNDAGEGRGVVTDMMGTLVADKVFAKDGSIATDASGKALKPFFNETTGNWEAMTLAQRNEKFHSIVPTSAESGSEEAAQADAAEEAGASGAIAAAQAEATEPTASGDAATETADIPDAEPTLMEMNVSENQTVIEAMTAFLDSMRGNISDADFEYLSEVLSSGVELAKACTFNVTGFAVSIDANGNVVSASVKWDKTLSDGTKVTGAFTTDFKTHQRTTVINGNLTFNQRKEMLGYLVAGKVITAAQAKIISKLWESNAQKANNCGFNITGFSFTQDAGGKLLYVSTLFAANVTVNNKAYVVEGAFKTDMKGNTITEFKLDTPELKGLTSELRSQLRGALLDGLVRGKVISADQKIKIEQQWAAKDAMLQKAGCRVVALNLKQDSSGGLLSTGIEFRKTVTTGSGGKLTISGSVTTEMSGRTTWSFGTEMSQL
ncbi:MAG TPA: hypothetical protein P5079_09675, partial [Elusimicrobiota bacterium]|nr:hypothetical protein [Elusimicrobiota bacterium]